MSPLAAGAAGADRILPEQGVLSGGLGALEAAAPVPAQSGAVSLRVCAVSTHASMTVRAWC